MGDKIMPPVHPGEVLKEDFLIPLGMSANSLAVHIGVPSRRMYEIIAGKRCISMETALRLARLFGTSHEFWLGLQDLYELQAAEDQGLVERIAREMRPLLRI
jgi:antitoxin HigA-1